VKTGRFADALTIMRPKTPEELTVFQGLVDWIYDEFVGKVAEGRKLDRAVVQEIGQGRVWSGAEALKLGLVDEMGGLDAAVRCAAGKAGLVDNYAVVEVPRHKELFEALSEAIEGRRREKTRAGPFGAVLTEVQETLALLRRLNDPKGVYARLPFDLRLN
jgi:protease-4